MLQSKRILLIVAGGIAAYKSLELIRRLKERGASVRCVLTAAGAEFVTPLSLGALSEDKVYTDLFSLTDEAEMGHIELSRDADLLVVAPATANLIAKMAAGIADDLAATVLLATDKKVLIAPAMNVRMWEHAATRRNVACLEADGILCVGPETGAMACGEYGPGRMAEPADIIAAIEAALVNSGALSGTRVLVTSGPTYEPIDPVRFIGNRSSGKQGHAIATAFAQLGAHVTLVAGPTAEADPPGVTTIHVETAQQMLAACEATLPADVAICAAAVADWRVAKPAPEKIKKGASKNEPTLALVRNPDILANLSARKKDRPRLVIGFAAETEKVEQNAREKLARKQCDWILANDVSSKTGAFGGDSNTLHLFVAKPGGQAKVEHWPHLSKSAIAARLAERIATTLKTKPIKAKS
ncbi:MAG: bifunctional phosphopantothenoylcysteine decarboxylase/phosphopantothenate--cysteine ligase CoaBC [Alphaproteobacteria bacterium]|nr:bifunctional phosphopantothenoylcysteine decarboxylase/phosphopantothenate--cysteine ligase CoaBC [Alphaproteobacteria bacterium]